MMVHAHGEKHKSASKFLNVFLSFAAVDAVQHHPKAVADDSEVWWLHRFLLLRWDQGKQGHH